MRTSTKSTKKSYTESSDRFLPVPSSHRAIVAKAKTKADKLGLSREDRENAKSMFGERSEEMLDLIQRNDKDGAVVLIYKQLLSMMVDLMPVAESVVRRSSGTKGIYQLNMMSSQIREMLTDMQAIQDRGMLGKTLIEKSVRPAFLDIAMQIVQAMHSVQTEVLAYVPPKNHDRVKALFADNRRGIGEYIQTQYKQVSDDLVKGLT